MKSLIPSCLLSAFLMSCSSIEPIPPAQPQLQSFCDTIETDSSYNPDLPNVESAELLGTAGPIFEGGSVICNVTQSFRPKHNIVRRSEDGLYGGVKYSIYYSDLSGVIQGRKENTLSFLTDDDDENWRVSCDKDGIDDLVSCSLRKKSLIALIRKNGSLDFRIGYQHYPGSEIVIRVDKLSPILAPENIGFSDEETKQIVELMRNGDAALIRHKKWPYNSNIDEELDLFGFSQALSMVYDLHRIISDGT